MNKNEILVIINNQTTGELLSKTFNEGSVIKSMDAASDFIYPLEFIGYDDYAIFMRDHRGDWQIVEANDVLAAKQWLACVNRVG